MNIWNIGIRILFKELKLEVIEPMKIYFDNKSTISIVHNLVQHDCIKHVKVDWLFIKQKIKSGQILKFFVVYLRQHLIPWLASSY